MNDTTKTFSKENIIPPVGSAGGILVGMPFGVIGGVVGALVGYGLGKGIVIALTQEGEPSATESESLEDT